MYSLADNRVHPGGVALRNLEAGQSTGFDDEVIHTKFDVLGFHFLHSGGEVVSGNNHRGKEVSPPFILSHVYLQAKTHSIEFFPKLNHLVHVDIYR